MTEPIMGVAEPLEKGHRVEVVQAIDDNDQLKCAGIREDCMDQGFKKMGSLPGGNDDRDGGEPPVGQGVVFIAWGAVGGRPAELAGALGADVLCLYPPGSVQRPSAPLRYLRCTFQTGRYVRRHRPRAIVVTNPPIIAGLITYGWAKTVGASIILDSHPGGFGVQGDRVAARLQVLHRWLVRRAVFSLVAAPKWGDVVRSWGGETEVVHEAPGPTVSVAPSRRGRLRILFVGRFAPDEPVSFAIAAAGQVPGCDLAVTGDVDRCPPDLRESASANVSFVGFLDAADYQAALADTDVVVCLTTEPGSVMRAAYEAVYARRPLIMSDWPIARELFPYALHVEHQTASLREAFQAAEARYEELVGVTEAARDLQMDRFEAQRNAVARRLSVLRSFS